MTVSPIKEIAGRPLSEEQTTYLTGFFAGMQQRAVVFADFLSDYEDASATGKKQEEEEIPLIAEERIKNEEHPLDSYYRLLENAQSNKAPDKEETFRFKWNGLFYLNPVKDAFMARMRIPGGIVKTYQLRGIAQTAKDLTSGYCQDHHTRQSANPAHSAQRRARGAPAHPGDWPPYTRRGRRQYPEPHFESYRGN